MTDLAGLLGLGYRSRQLTVGVDRVRQALQQDEVHCVVIAQDATRRVHDKVVRLAEGKQIPLVIGPDAARLDHVFTDDVVGLLHQMSAGFGDEELGAHAHEVRERLAEP